MYLANFASWDELMELTTLHASKISSKTLCVILYHNFVLDNAWVWLDERMANGDGTDSWCKSGGIVPYEMYHVKTYIPPVCGDKGCFNFVVFATNPFFSGQHAESTCAWYTNGFLCS